jgi:hypothetical protein
VVGELIEGDLARPVLRLGGQLFPVALRA